MSKILESVLTPELLDEMSIVDWGVTLDPIASSWDKFDDWVSKGLNDNIKHIEGNRKDKRLILEK